MTPEEKAAAAGACFLSLGFLALLVALGAALAAAATEPTAESLALLVARLSMVIATGALLALAARVAAA